MILWSINDVANYNGLDHEIRKLLTILGNHIGRDNAISMLRLYEQWSGENLPPQLTRNIATISRRMRMLLDVLIDTHEVPVMSSSRRGYWIIGNEDELDEVVAQFRSRGLRSLAKAATFQRISLKDELKQAALEL